MSNNFGSICDELQLHVVMDVDSIVTLLAEVDVR
jgi:hypothetical protein